MSVPPRIAPIILALTIAATSWAGCITEERGSIVLYVKGTHHEDLEELFVKFSDIRVHRAGAAADADDDEGPGWVTVEEGPIEIDLLDFTIDGTRAILANGTIESGRYDRIVLGVAEPRARQPNETEDPQVALAEDHARVTAHFSLGAGETTTILLTIDVRGGLEEAGEADYSFTPLVSDVAIEEDARQLQRTVSNEGVQRQDGDAGER